MLSDGADSSPQPLPSVDGRLAGSLRCSSSAPTARGSTNSGRKLVLLFVRVTFPLASSIWYF